MQAGRLEIAEEIGRAVGQTLIVSGAARSGTTIVGKLVYSLADIEYLFEPPLLFGLIPQIGELPEANWKLLFETYLFEDFLVDAVAGRRVNLNHHDDSSIYGAKSAAEVGGRLARSWRKTEAYERARDRRIAFKMPDILPYVGLLQAYYPSIEVVVTLRQPETLIASLLRKGWFNEASLERRVEIWPFRLRDGRNVPFFVPAADESRWITAEPIEKCCLYYTWMYGAAAGLTGIRLVDYDRLIRQPAAALDQLLAQLSLERGTLTGEILAQIDYQPTSSKIVLQGVDADLLRQVRDVYGTCLARCIP